MKLLRPPLFATVLALLFFGGSLALSNRSFVAPPRDSFSLFPMRFAAWEGQTERLSPEIVQALKVEDYLLANYRASGRPDWVNFYVAYYDQQLLGSAAHSPRSCIPGDGAADPDRKS